MQGFRAARWLNYNLGMQQMEADRADGDATILPEGPRREHTINRRYLKTNGSLLGYF